MNILNTTIKVICRGYGTKYKKSIINYKQMPDAFYNLKHSYLPPKIFTACLRKVETMSSSDKIRKFLNDFQYDYDITIPALTNTLINSQLKKIKSMQMIPLAVVNELGVELSVAHLILHMGGAIKLLNSDSWIGPLRRREISRFLPHERVQDFYIESIDLSGCLVTYEGLEYIPALNYLKDLSLRNSPFLDNFCLNRISRMRFNLEYLDISNCPLISGRGLETLWNLKKLKELVLENNPLMEDKELVCLLLNEKLPDLEIRGVDYLEGLNIDQQNRVLQLIEPEVYQLPRQYNETNDNMDNNESAEHELNNEENKQAYKIKS